VGNSFNSKGNIEGSAIAVGDHASASIVSGPGQSADPAVEALRSELLKLVERLRVIAGELDDSDGVADTADEVESELAVPTPRWRRVLGLLRGVGPSVAALTGLANDVRTLETAVEAMLPN
jgi:hypothetical protein